jgi:hypothetical protein
MNRQQAEKRGRCAETRRCWPKQLANVCSRVTKLQ